jgi:hypothetical protein
MLGGEEEGTSALLDLGRDCLVAAMAGRLDLTIVGLVIAVIAAAAAALRRYLE